MLQENSFFSQPIVYFGSPHLIDEEEEEDEAIFSDPWLNFIQMDLPIRQSPRIGLFIHWCDLNE